MEKPAQVGFSSLRRHQEKRLLSRDASRGVLLSLQPVLQMARGRAALEPARLVTSVGRHLDETEEKEEEDLGPAIESIGRGITWGLSQWKARRIEG